MVTPVVNGRDEMLDVLMSVRFVVAKVEGKLTGQRSNWSEVSWVGLALPMSES